MMKKKYKKPHVGLLCTKCHVSSLSSERPEKLSTSRRSLLMRAGMIATVGQLTPLHASGGIDDGGKSASQVW